MNRNGPSGGRDLLGSELITREVPIVFAKHSKIGYKSSFHYCVERLHLSEWLGRIAHPRRECKAVLEYLVHIEPKPVFEPSIRRRPDRPMPVEAVSAERPAPPPRELTMSARQLSPSSPNILQPARPTVFNFRFSADRSFKDKFERWKARRRQPKPHLVRARWRKMSRRAWKTSQRGRDTFPPRS